MTPFDIGGRSIGDSHACYLIAEAGVNHNGDVDTAHRLVDAAADAGADAVKFQTFDPDELAAPDAARAAYQESAMGEAGSQLDMLRRLVLPREAYPALMHHAARRSVTFLSTPFDESSADFLDGLGVAAFKLSSGDVTHLLLLRHVARKGKPMVISTGMSDMDDVRLAIRAVRDVAPVPIAVLHCVSNYPADPDTCNLRAIKTLRDTFDVPVGFSDHTIGDHVALGAVALGAVVIEKHLTLDRGMPGPDHLASADPAALGAMVRKIRELELALGSPRKHRVASEQPIARIGRRSLYWRRRLPAGHIVSEDDLVALRPDGGVGAGRWAEIVGRRVARDVGVREPVRFEDLQA